VAIKKEKERSKRPQQNRRAGSANIELPGGHKKPYTITQAEQFGCNVELNTAA